MNWGTKLAIGMASFIIFIIVLGILMIRSKTDALVDADYYERGLQYDADYRRKEQVKQDMAEPVIQIQENHLILTFKNQAEGTASLIRAADKRLDKKIIIKSDKAHQVFIPLNGLATGQWRLVLEWTAEGKAYLFEQEIRL